MKNQKYINGLLENDNLILNEIYANYFSAIEQYILNNSGTSNDAQDVFQDGLMVIYNKAQSEDFELTSSFHTYLYSICRFTWLRKMRKSSKYTSLPERFEESEELDFSFEEAIYEREKHKIFRDNFEKLKLFCQKILNYYFSDLSMEEIAVKLELKNAHTARNRKYRCQKELEKLVILDKRYKELNEDKT